MEAVEDTAQAQPRIDAIGGSATGTISGDIKAALRDVFLNVSPDLYMEKVLPKEFGNAPLKVINDGGVFALAGMMVVWGGASWASPWAAAREGATLTMMAT